MVVIPKKDDLPSMEENNNDLKKDISNEQLFEALINLEQRIINIESCLLRIRGSI